MNSFITIFSFLLFTAAVAVGTWLLTRNEETQTESGFFLAGHSLTFPIIAGSLLLTNLSTEQMVGLNGSAFQEGLLVMVWEVEAVVALVAMGLFFLPRFLKSGITTIPQLLEKRFDFSTSLICNIIFLVAYATILLPIVLYTGAKGLASILDLKALTGIQSDKILLWGMIFSVGLIGAIYALFGGLRSVAISDTLNGIGLLIGGLLITFLGLKYIGAHLENANGVAEGGCLTGLSALMHAIPEKFNSIGGNNASVPFGSVFTGVLTINMFYWCTNQQIIQRTLAARNLAEGQKGIFLCGALKLLGPLFLVLPGMMAYYIFVRQGLQPALRPVDAYGTLVQLLLPKVLVGFFAAVMIGAIFSSFNSALNSTCTMFSLGLYKTLIRRQASEQDVVRSSRWFGWIIACAAMLIAPLLDGQESIFNYLQKMNGIYFIPIFAVVLMALLNRQTPAIAAKISLIAGVILIALTYFVFPGLIPRFGGEYHFLAIVFALLLAIMGIWGTVAPAQNGDCLKGNSGSVDLTPWRHAKLAGILLLLLVILIYALFADFSILAR